METISPQLFPEPGQRLRVRRDRPDRTSVQDTVTQAVRSVSSAQTALENARRELLVKNEGETYHDTHEYLLNGGRNGGRCSVVYELEGFAESATITVLGLRGARAEGRIVLQRAGEVVAEFELDEVGGEERRVTVGDEEGFDRIEIVHDRSTGAFHVRGVEARLDPDLDSIVDLMAEVDQAQRILDKARRELDRATRVLEAAEQAQVAAADPAPAGCLSAPAATAAEKTPELVA